MLCSISLSLLVISKRTWRYKFYNLEVAIDYDVSDVLRLQ